MLHSIASLRVIFEVTNFPKTSDTACITWSGRVADSRIMFWA